MIEGAKKLGKLAPDKNRQYNLIFEIINRLLIEAYDIIEPETLITNFYDLYYLINAYIHLASIDDPKIQSHKDFIAKTIFAAIEDEKTYKKALPTKARPLSFAVENLTKYLMLMSEKGETIAEEKELTEREFILQLLRQAEEELTKNDAEGQDG